MSAIYRILTRNVFEAVAKQLIGFPYPSGYFLSRFEYIHCYLGCYKDT